MPLFVMLLVAFVHFKLCFYNFCCRMQPKDVGENMFLPAYLKQNSRVSHTL